MDEFDLNLVALLAVSTIVGMTPFIMIAITSFVKLSVVLFLIRNAIGVQQTPPNMILYGLAVILTVYISSPMLAEIYAILSDPSIDYESFADLQRAAEAAREPVRKHLLRYTNPKEREFFLSATARIWPEEAQQIVTSEDLIVLIPSFVVSELTRAFEIGFLIYLPFVIIDLVVSTILMSLGMIMVSPLVISVPFKLFLFVMIDGWSRLMHGLVLTYS